MALNGSSKSSSTSTPYPKSSSSSVSSSSTLSFASMKAALHKTKKPSSTSPAKKSDDLATRMEARAAYFSLK
ncbi:hypothetical protein AJ79_09275 [Helicocarpus griseus UAMH5409]|uniref:Uncharacterized protein n=1 Tax=Helicocarpus griseus UAMH5409 TaxID=1447875 RepID=A0A2B7WL47_9EURO|nr:hypothetical protein AJ79_09275 [Helicocarpus griseus UAMH5409]